MRILTILSGFLLIGAGIWSFAHPGAPFLTIAFLLGVAMLVSGLSHLFAYAVFRKAIPYISWRLAEGVIAIILAGIVLSGFILTDAMTLLFFGMWALFSGALAIAVSGDAHKTGAAGWYFILLIGLLNILAGIYSFMDPLLAGLALVIMVGGIFILQGISCVVSGIFLRSEPQPQAFEKGKELQTEGQVYEKVGV